MPNGVDPISPTQLSSFSGNDKYPLDMPIDKGYGVNTPTQYPSGHNAWFINQRNEKLPLYVTDVELSLEMAGEIVQSQNVRQFFPSNLVQPSIEIMGIMPSSYHFNNLASFVRQSQDTAVFGGQENSDKLMEFRLFNHSIGDSDANAFPYQGGRKNGQQITKGRHKGLSVMGYIQSAQAGARKENHAPEWQITMMVAEMRKGPWEDKLVPSGTLESWMDMFYGLTAEQKAKTFVQQETRQAPAQKPPETQNGNGNDNNDDSEGILDNIVSGIGDLANDPLGVGDAIGDAVSGLFG